MGENFPAELFTDVAEEHALWVVEVELLAECGSCLTRGDALLSVLGDFGGTFGGLSLALSHNDELIELLGSALAVMNDGVRSFWGVFGAIVWSSLWVNVLT